MTLRDIARQIVSDDAGTSENGWAFWRGNHSCGTHYGCCGGGTEINNDVLIILIESALLAAESRGAQRALKEAAERATFLGAHVFAAELKERADALSPSPSQEEL